MKLKNKAFILYMLSMHTLLGGISIMFIVGNEKYNILGWFLLVVASTSLAFTLTASENMNI